MHAVKICAEIGHANRWVVRWIINNVLLFPVELSTSSRTLQSVTQQETVTHCLLFILQPMYLHNLSPHTSSQPITSSIYQPLLYLLNNQIAQQGFWIFKWLRLSLTFTWLWRWLPHRLSELQSQTKVPLRTLITQMIFFNQGTTFFRLHINNKINATYW